MHTAIIAGVQAAKRTPEWIPFCHSISLEACEVRIQPTEHGFCIDSECATTGKTGVEMEALTAVAAAALCLVDMCKALTSAARIESIALIEKRGGKRDYLAES